MLFCVLLLAAFFAASQPAGAAPVTDCLDLRALSTTQICMGAERSWVLAGDDTVAIPDPQASSPVKLTLNGDTLEIRLIATSGNPDGIDKFYLTSGNLSLLPPFARLDSPGEILGPYTYGAPATGRTITLGAAELNTLFEWQNSAGGIVILEEQVGRTIDNPGVETFTGVTLAGTPPPSPPTSATATSGANIAGSCAVGDPINTYTGELVETGTPDIDLGGPMPLRFSRYYASGLKAANISGPLGDNWLHNFAWTLTSNGSTADVISNQGRLIRFTKNAAQWSLYSRQDVPYQLVEDTNTGQFTLADPSSKRSYRFSAAGQLLAIDDNQGGTHSLAYDAGGRLVSVSDGLGRTLNFTYDSTNRLVGAGDGQGRTVSFTYSGNDLASFTDLNGNTTTYAYDNGGLLTAITLPAGNTPSRQTWNDAGKVAAQTDARGNTTTFTYNEADTTITDALGNTTVHTYSTTGKLEQVVRQDGTTFSLSSNTTGQRNGITDSLGGTTRYTYHAPSGRIAAITHANGATTSFDYTARTTSDGITVYDLTGITHADGTTKSLAYDATGHLVSYTDQAGFTTTYTYNSHGQWLTHANPAGGTNTRIFNKDGTLASQTDAAGNTTTFGYDTQRRLMTATLTDGSTTTLAYDDMDRPVALTDPKGRATRFEWNANGNLATVTDRTGAVTTFTFDAMDRLSTVTDNYGNIGRVDYDELGRIAAVTERSGSRITFGYDQQNRLTALTDGNGNTWRRSFDAEGILRSTTTPLGNGIRFTSNDMGRITAITSPLGNKSQLTYDLMGHVTQTIDPLGYIRTTDYDPRGLPTKRTLPENISASYKRDALGNITAVTDPGGNDWRHTFDNAGRLTSSSDPLSRTTAYTYDQGNRLKTVTFPGDLGTRSDEYDANGNLIRQIYSDGTELSFTHDAEDRLTGADGLTLSRDALGRITASNGLAISYDAGGRIAAITYATGKTITYRYDANGNLTKITDWAGGVSTFTWDADNRLTAMTRPNGITTTYSYDADGQFTAITHGTLGSITLTRDAGGRITAASRDLPQAASATGLADTTHSFDAAAQISSPGHVYDTLGRLTDDGTTTYTWNLASRLTAVGTTTHAYDALGYRTRRTAGGITRDYVWNHALTLPATAIEREAGTDLRYYIHTPDGALLYAIDAATNARHFYHFDESGNTRFVTDDGGVVIASYAHTPFGVLLGRSGDLDNPFTWQGQWGVYDDGDGLYYIRARYYDADSGRFLSRDPLHMARRELTGKPAPAPEHSLRMRPQDAAQPFTDPFTDTFPGIGGDDELLNPLALNPYTFAYANPMYFHDPDGKEPITIVVVGGAIVAAGSALYRLGKWFELTYLEKKVGQENGRLLDDTELQYRSIDECTMDELHEEVVNVVSTLPGTTATGPVHGAPVDDVTQFATQTAITTTGLDRPAAQSPGILSTAWNYWKQKLGL